MRRLSSIMPGIFRQIEHDVETVINVLQPGPLGIIEHKFSAEEIREAKATVRRAIENWQRNAANESSDSHRRPHAMNEP